MALLGFGRRREPADDTARRRVEEWVRDLVEPGTVVKVNEILCPDPSCPGLETIVLVMRPGRKTQAAKVAKPLAEVTRAEVEAALADLT
ncbi:hypothetical protein [Methylobacterium sp. WL19]|uniref:hypothetical protein n=1 Tax=Methylobacterium sp. WL19 TaxID=2603896 RepID=UPI0011C9989E|nr:hypothetical protein [Methylobacterium sp. WL19]TXN32944.1 hypothetical protein FV220_04395 [Methylobacterium sp. WL19]